MQWPYVSPNLSLLSSAGSRSFIKGRLYKACKRLSKEKAQIPWESRRIEDSVPQAMPLKDSGLLPNWAFWDRVDFPILTPCL